MKELPEELTPELLSLVYPDYNNRLCEWMEIENNELNTYYDCGHYDSEGRPTGLGMTINLDTLTRLMKEWCMETTKLSIRSRLTLSMNWECRIKISNKVRFSTSNEAIYTEFEAVLKATHWVAKEKGLINGR